MVKEVTKIEKGKAKRQTMQKASSKIVKFNSNTIDTGYNFKYQLR